MAAAKHTLSADGAALAPRPSKKTKVDSAEAQGKAGATSKKEKKDKKPKTGETAEADAARRAEKEAKKARKQAEREARPKLNEAEAETRPTEKTAGNGIGNGDEDGDGDGDETKPKGAYVQTMSLSSVPQADIDAFLAAHHIDVSDPRPDAGVAAPRPVTGFEHLPSTNLLEKRPSPFAGFEAPTPIQAASWPFTLAGRDVLGVAETGSGKTMAFALPCIEAVSAAAEADEDDDHGQRRGKGKRPGKGTAKKTVTRAVVVSPTRELAMQTHEQLARLAALVGLQCVCLYGGASKDDQRAALRRGADVVVATPGRLKDLMAEGAVALGGAGFVVLDEADRMLDKGFEDDIRHILGCCPGRRRRQTLMFTATWPQSVQGLAASLMADPVKVTVGGGAGGGAGEPDGGVALHANARVAQAVEVVDPHDKEGRLLQILRQRQQGARRADRILVFCLYKKEATRVEALLRRKGVRVASIHGDLRQEQRTRSLEAFKSGDTPVLVATDVAARGLDIPEVKLVINVTVRLWWGRGCHAAPLVSCRLFSFCATRHSSRVPQLTRLLPGP